MQFLLILMFLSSQEVQIFSEEIYLASCNQHYFLSNRDTHQKDDFIQQSEEAELEEESEENIEEESLEDTTSLLPTPFNLSCVFLIKSINMNTPASFDRLFSPSVSQRAPPVLSL